MKRTLYLLTLVVAIIGGLVLYNQHTDEARREREANARFEAGMRRMKLETKCMELKNLLIKRGDSLAQQQLELADKGFTLNCQDMSAQ
jgi:hypothetical protein